MPISADIYVERVDHRSYARQGIDMEPTVKIGHALAAIEPRAEREQIAASEEPHDWGKTKNRQRDDVIASLRRGYLEDR